MNSLTSQSSSDSDPWQWDGARITRAISEGRLSATELTRSVLHRVHWANPSINALVSVLDAEALEAAAAIDAARARGDRLPPLAGVPVTTKVNVDQRGLATDNGVPVLKNLIASTDSPVVAALREAGAIIIGRSNTPGLSMRGHTDNALHGPTFNPLNRALTPGGSSGGAAAAVAAGLGAIAHGNDIGGSIRWPAYCNGVVGLRPSPGRVARINDTAPAGRPLSSQLMAVDGPLARTVGDVRRAFEVMAGRPDARDNRWVPVPLRLPTPAAARSVALVTRADGPAVHPSCWEAVRKAGQHLAAAGYQVEEVQPPDMHMASELWSALGTTEQSLFLGPKLAQSGDPGIAAFLGHWWALRPPRDLTGYLQAHVERDALLQRWTLFFERWPIVIMPASIGAPPLAGIDVQGAEGARAMIDALYFQLMLPVLGLPGLALPIDVGADMPQGVQLFGARWREDLLLDAGEVIEAHEGQRQVVDPRGASAH